MPEVANDNNPPEPTMKEPPQEELDYCVVCDVDIWLPNCVDRKCHDCHGSGR